MNRDIPSSMACSTTYSHPDCDALCREIAKKSNGVCFAMCSLGKDSLAAILYLKQFFSRIIPFHCASYPLLKCTDRWLRYYEDALGMHILRLVGEELPMGLARAMYQTADDLGQILDLETPDYSKLDILEWLRKEFSLPKAWCAVGISVGDSIDRRIYCKKVGGRNENNKTFYPLYLAERQDILSIIRNSGMKLPDSYLYACRSIGGVPSYTWQKILDERYHEDFERFISMFPLAPAKTYREKMLDAAWQKRKDAGIVDDEGDVSDVDGGDVGADTMPGVMEGGE